MHLALMGSTVAQLRIVANIANRMSTQVDHELATANTATFWSLVGAVTTLLGTLAVTAFVLARQWRGLIAARRAAQAAAIAKTAFLAGMSHEIRTPMNGVLGSVSLLAQGRLSPEQRRLVETISSCGASAAGPDRRRARQQPHR